MNREKIIIRTSVQGIIVNLFLVIFKAIAGFLAGSIAVVLDALNNLTDMLSSVITIIGTILAGRSPDREHPYGHGRIEYVTALAVGLIILAAGAASLVEAVPKIFAPEVPDYSIITIAVVAVAVLVKFFFGQYVKNTGKKVNSSSLTASGLDAIFDAGISFGTLVGIFISLIWQISLDGIIGTIIAVFIIKASIEILHDGWLDIIGRRVDSELSKNIKSAICKFPHVSGAYDLTLHNYGPTEVIGSVHVQVPDQMTAQEIHKLTREIIYKIYTDFHVILTVGIYAENTSSKTNQSIKNTLSEIIKSYPEILQMHGFYVDDENKLVAFDLIIEHQQKDKNRIKNQVVRKLRAKFPDYKYLVTLDVDISD